MAKVSSKYFYSNLQQHLLPLTDLLAQPTLFSKVPEDWHVVLTDIKNSTAAVAGGHHEKINLVATGSIIAVLNLVRRENFEVPFFFGGDGATLLVPPDVLEATILSLKQHQQNTLRNFELELRVGSLQVSEIYEAGKRLLIAKLQVEKGFWIPVISGTGLSYAENLIKGKNTTDAPTRVDEVELDMTGMECRWDRIKPPGEQKEVVCLLVVFCNEENDLEACKEVIDGIEKIYGSRKMRNPISVQALRPNPAFAKIRAETQVKLGRTDWLYLLRTTLITLFAKWFYLPFFRSGKQYIRRLVALSDTLVLDGRINTVISGTVQQRKLLTNLLQKMEERGAIVYGLQACSESVMSCYVRDRLDQHIHFVDGANGGYTLAAKQLKSKLRLRR